MLLTAQCAAYAGRGRLSFLVTRGCQYTQANFFLLFICIKRSMRLQFWRGGQHQVNIRPKEYNLNLLVFMSLHFVPHLPMLDVMVVEKLCGNEKRDN